MMKEKISALLAEIETLTAQTAAQAEELRIRYLSKKGSVSVLFDDFKTVAPEEKREVGQLLNQLKTAATDKINSLKEAAEASQGTAVAGLDLSRPADAVAPGARHPLSIILNRINEIFGHIGFVVEEGPEIVDDWHNFTALNFAEEHPARDMQDTFFVEGEEKMLLRTHTSTVQVKIMQSQKPPIRAIMPGRVYRNEAISARAHCFFHQVEGLYVDENVSFADLKQTLLYFAKELFGESTKIRLRPSYFPFTEPSAEMDISCTICGGKGCNICKYSGWVEILGCGMVDPAVLENAGIDSTKYTGFAFGMGVERIAQLKFQVKDLRLYSENDVRFLGQFKSALL